MRHQALSHEKDDPAAATPEPLATLRAAVEVIVPAVEGRPGGAEQRAEEYVVMALESSAAGLAHLAAATLDEFAQTVREGTTFAELSIAERDAVLKRMSKAETASVRQLTSGLLSAAFMAVYSEWSSGGALDDRPPVWDAMGYTGPSEGYPRYREGV